MVFEVAILFIKDNTADQFETDFGAAGKYISPVKVIARITLKKCLERKNKYILLVEGDNLDDHVTGFKKSEHYNEWKKLLHHYYDLLPTVKQYVTIL